MRALRNLKLQLQQIAAKFINTFTGLPFTLHLKYLVWKYKGGENIPLEELKKLNMIPDEEHEVALLQSIHLTTALMAVMERFGLEWSETKTGAVISYFVRGELNDADLHQRIQGIMTSARPRREIYKLMLDLQDLGGPPAGEDPLALGAWLDEVIPVAQPTSTSRAQRLAVAKAHALT